MWRIRQPSIKMCLCRKYYAILLLQRYIRDMCFTTRVQRTLCVFKTLKINEMSIKNSKLKTIRLWTSLKARHFLSISDKSEVKSKKVKVFRDALIS